jgi:hypothetical protein
MIPNIIIIATSSYCEEIEPVGESSLDWQIRHALMQKRHPIIVLGANGDALFRTSRALGQCEFVFDPNEEYGFLSALKAGLTAVNKPSFFVAAKVRLASPLSWQRFEAEWNGHSAQPYHLLSESPTSLQIAQHPGLVTRKGLNLLLESEASQLTHLPIEVLTTKLRDDSIDTQAS